MLNAGDPMLSLWHREKIATDEALEASKREALTYLASERELVMRLTREEALRQLIDVRKLDSRARYIERLEDGGLLNVATA
jgi:hypothetical protein